MTHQRTYTVIVIYLFTFLTALVIPLEKDRASWQIPVYFYLSIFLFHPSNWVSMCLPMDIASVWRVHHMIRANVWHILNFGQLIPSSKKKNTKTSKGSERMSFPQPIHRNQESFPRSSCCSGIPSLPSFAHLNSSHSQRPQSTLHGSLSEPTRPSDHSLSGLQAGPALDFDWRAWCTCSYFSSRCV